MENTYLNLYYNWMKTGLLPGQNGLCSEFGFLTFINWQPEWHFDEHPLFELFADGQPTGIFWADDCNSNGIKFTPLRQTIVLLMAAMNNEL